MKRRLRGSGSPGKATALRTDIDSGGRFDILANVESTVPEVEEGLDATCQVFVFDRERVERARKLLLSTEEAQEAGDFFKALAHPTRIQILRALGQEELCVCDLARVLGLSVSATSYQLQLMRRVRLVRYRNEGKLAYYRVADNLSRELLHLAARRLPVGIGP